MSVSRFHHHFKSVTAISPLQYLKQIRLQEARRLMLNESIDAATAGFRVGYEDPAYFSRDYKKQFGAPPQRDIVRLRRELKSVTALQHRPGPSVLFEDAKNRSIARKLEFFALRSQDTLWSWRRRHFRPAIANHSQGAENPV